MSLIKPDFSEMKEDVSPGTYQVRVVDHEMGSWAGKDGKPDTQYIKWTLETVGEADPKNNGRRIWHSTPYTGGGAFRLANFFKACTGEELNKENPEFDTDMLMSRELMVTVDKNPKGYIEVKSEAPVA